MKLNIRKGAETAVLFGLICAVLLSVSHFNAACDDLRGSVLRLHILANSDSADDQQLKLAVRDRILAETVNVFDGEANLAEAERTAVKSLAAFTAAANQVIAENGFSYTASAEIGESYFETREYEDFTLPAGTYRSLIIKLGRAEGKNWWCVVFPAICVPAASEASLSDSAAKTSAQIAEHPAKYQMRFKTVEWYEDLKKALFED